MDNLEILKLFPESVFKYKFEKFENFNPELSNYIYNLNKSDKAGVTKSNRGGWHSEDFDLRDSNSIQVKFALELQKYILNKSDAGKKAQNFLKSKLENGLKNLSAKEKKIQEEEKKIIQQKKSNIT